MTVCYTRADDGIMGKMGNMALIGHVCLFIFLSVFRRNFKFEKFPMED